ncbi:MAG: ParA family protein [Rubrivivax sp.]|nr:ParA family protein [Rubrivivax sp.]
MTVIAIVNRKGGSGKSTLATHVAAWLSQRGERAMLGDVDRQQSVVQWLRRRERAAPAGEPLVGWALDPRNVLRPPVGVAHVVLDTPGGLHGLEMNRLLAHADIVLMPLGDSIFDRESAAACLAEMRAHPRVASARVQVAALGMRIDAQTGGEARLAEWAAGLDLPFLGALGDARAYVRAAETGLTIFDLPPAEVAPDLVQWQPVLDALVAALAAAEAARAADSRPMPLAAAGHPALPPAPVFRPSRPIVRARAGNAVSAPARPPSLQPAAAGSARLRPAEERPALGAVVARIKAWFVPRSLAA